MYRDLPVTAEIKDLFKYIDKYVFFLSFSLVLF